MSRNLVKTPAAVSAGGGSTSLWVLRLLSATSPTSPFSATSARTDSSCRPYKVEGAAAERQEGCGHRLPSPEARMMSLSTPEGSSGAASSVWRWDLKPWISAPNSSLASWFPFHTSSNLPVLPGFQVTSQNPLCCLVPGGLKRTHKLGNKEKNGQPGSQEQRKKKIWMEI